MVDVTDTSIRFQLTDFEENHAVCIVQARYREDEEANAPANIMSDRRVVRGNTYAAQILPANVAQEHEQERSMKKSSSGGAAKQKSSRSTTRTARTGRREYEEPPVEGRRHMDVQTDAYLEELEDIPGESDRGTQTDAFLDRPPEPEFVPMKVGYDQETQIEPGELFDFDMEVEPILETLVGKVLEQGTMEVQEEEELAALRAHQEHFEQIRSAELAATQRMEAAEKRKQEEKERRLAQERDRLDREADLRRKIAASSFARGLLHGMVRTAFSSLREQGHFHDPVRHAVQNDFLPQLFENASAHIEQEQAARNAVDSIIASAERLRQQQQEEAAAQAQRVHHLLDEQEARREQARRQVQEQLNNRVESDATYIINESGIVSSEQVDEARTEVQQAEQERLQHEHEEYKQRLKQERDEERRVAAEEAKAAQEDNAESEHKAATTPDAQTAGEDDEEEEEEKPGEEEDDDAEEQAEAEDEQEQPADDGTAQTEEEESVWLQSTSLILRMVAWLLDLQDAAQHDQDADIVQMEPPQAEAPTSRVVLEKLLEKGDVTYEGIAEAIVERDAQPAQAETEEVQE